MPDYDSLIPILYERVKSFFEARHQSRERDKWLYDHIAKTMIQAYSVQCIGMDQPIPITDIYQPLLCLRGSEWPVTGNWRARNPRDFLTLLTQGSGLVVTGGPGCGKTTLLRWSHVHLTTTSTMTPILFVLRWTRAVDDLEQFVRDLKEHGKPKALVGTPLVLLIDGYDEIDESARKRVSDIIRDFSALGVGRFALTCRSFYDVLDLAAPIFVLAPFEQTDACDFVRAFQRYYSFPDAPEKVIGTLVDNGLREFISNPLMLTMVCLVKASPDNSVPRTQLGLLKKAVDTLTFRWDKSRGIQRESELELVGHERLRALMTAAYEMEGPAALEHVVERATANYLKQIGKPVDVRQLLFENAQWYGILVPSYVGAWEFASRTLQDYLAARYWEDIVGFEADRVEKWSDRAAYATALSKNPSACILAALKAHFLDAYLICQENHIPLNANLVGPALLEFFEKSPEVFTVIRQERTIFIEGRRTFTDRATNEFLEHAAMLAAQGESDAGAYVLGNVLAEIHLRGAIVRGDTCRMIRRRYAHDSLEFRVSVGARDVRFRLGELWHEPE